MVEIVIGLTNYLNSVQCTKAKYHRGQLRFRCMSNSKVSAYKCVITPHNINLQLMVARNCIFSINWQYKQVNDLKLGAINA